MTARMRRITSDWEQVKKDFAGHKNIVVVPVGDEPPEKYKVTYYVDGIHLAPDGRVETLCKHEVEITLHAEYPRYKPICRILTPIWHPNFRDGQICIGDIWGASESLSDIIVNIGDMIQYKSWNSYSPLSAEAAKWAMENRHLFPVGNVDLYVSDDASANHEVEIELFDDDGNEAPIASEAPPSEAETLPLASPEGTEAAPAEGCFEPAAAGSPEADAAPDTGLPAKEAPGSETPVPEADPAEQNGGNDFEITAEELAGIQFIPSAQRMQTVSHNTVAQGRSINFKTIFFKGLLWGLIGGIVGFILQEVFDASTNSDAVLGWLGYEFSDLLDMDESAAINLLITSVRLSTAIFSAFIACSLGLLMGIGEGVFYGSAEKAVKNGLIGAGISLLIGFVSGFLAQAMYSRLVSDNASDFVSALVRGLSWAIMGLGVGISIGLIKPQLKRVLFCGIGGLAGGFIGGFLFEPITEALSFGKNDTGVLGRAVGIILMGLLIGLGIGLLEQVAKQAWLKVVRGEFEGKEYLVFAGTTSIGNNGKNTIVLFKDRLVAPHHCDIALEGSRYVLTDSGSPLGTIVNGARVSRHVLRQGDAIAIGNSVLIFNTK